MSSPTLRSAGKPPYELETSSEHFFSPRTENRLLVKWERTGIDAQASVMGDRDLRFVDHSKRERAIISKQHSLSWDREL